MRILCAITPHVSLSVAVNKSIIYFPFATVNVGIQWFKNTFYFETVLILKKEWNFVRAHGKAILGIHKITGNYESNKKIGYRISKTPSNLANIPFAVGKFRHHSQILFYTFLSSNQFHWFNSTGFFSSSQIHYRTIPSFSTSRTYFFLLLFISARKRNEHETKRTHKKRPPHNRVINIIFAA